MSTASKTPLLVATLIAALGLVVAGAALAWACTQRATIDEVNPASGTPGGTTTVHGKHFVDGEVDIYWDSVTSKGTRNHLATVPKRETYSTEDGIGFSKTVTIPDDARVGDHHIVARSAADSGGNQYQAMFVFEVTEPSDSQDTSGSPQDPGGDSSQDTSGSPAQGTSGESSQESGSPSEETSSEPTQNTESSQTTSGPTSQETSAAGSREEGGDTAGTSTMPGLGSGDDQARSEPTNETRPEPTPDQSQQPASAEEPAQNRDSVGQAPQPDPQPAPQNQPATDGRDQVGAETPAQPTPAPQPSAPDDGQTAGTEQAEPAPAPTTDQSATSESGEQVFEGSVGPSQSTEGESGRADDPLADGEAQQPDPQAAESEADAEDNRPSGQDADTPSDSSAGADLWSGLESGETPSLTPSPGETTDSDPRGGMAGALMAGVALLGLGMAGLLATAGVVAVRRRRLATATRAQR